MFKCRTCKFLTVELWANYQWYYCPIYSYMSVKPEIVRNCPHYEHDCKHDAECNPHLCVCKED